MTVAFHMGSSFIQKTPIYCCVFDVISMGHMRVTLEARTLWPPLEMLMGSEHTDWLHWHKRANNATHPSSVLVLGPKKHCSATRMGLFLLQKTLLAQCGGRMSQPSSGSLGGFGVPTGDRVGVSGAGRRRLIHSDQALVSQPITQRS